MAVFTRPSSISIVAKDGGTVNLVQGDQHIHYHITGPAEVTVPKAIDVQVAGKGSAEFQPPPSVKLTRASEDQDGADGD